VFESGKYFLPSLTFSAKGNVLHSMGKLKALPKRSD
jgi:hypothetical protein